MKKMAMCPVSVKYYNKIADINICYSSELKKC